MLNPATHFLFVFLSSSYWLRLVTAKNSCSDSSIEPFSLSLTDCNISRPVLQDVFSWGIKLAVGSQPQTQELCFTPSTVTNNTLLIDRVVCSGPLENMTFDQCESRRGSTFEFTTAGSSFHNLSNAHIPDDSGWLIFGPAPSLVGTTDIGLVSDLVLHNMTVELITEGDNFTAAHLGLGNDSLLLHSLLDAKLIPSLSWGLNAGSQSILNPRDGNLVLGGFDAASIKGPFFNYTIGPSITVADRVCPIQIVINQMHLLLEGRDPVDMISEGDAHSACIEPYDNLFRLSGTTLDRFKDKTGWSNDTTYDLNQIYVTEPGLVYPSQTGFNGSLRFILSGGLTVTIPNFELVHPLRGLNPNGEKVIQDNITEVSVYGESIGAWVLPKAFLSQMYLAVDYERHQFHLADVVQHDVAQDLVPFTSISGQCSKRPKLSKRSIAAVVVGTVVPILIIGGLGYGIHRWRCRNREAYELPTIITNETTAESQSPEMQRRTEGMAPADPWAANGGPEPETSYPFSAGPREMDSVRPLRELEASITVRLDNPSQGTRSA